MRYYCPRGASYPLLVGGGNYSTGGGHTTYNRTRSGQQPCEPGSYCIGAISILCPPGSYGNTYGLSHSSCTGKYVV